jgi:hypothetical protein
VKWVEKQRARIKQGEVHEMGVDSQESPLQINQFIRSDSKKEIEFDEERGGSQ